MSVGLNLLVDERRALGASGSDVARIAASDVVLLRGADGARPNTILPTVGPRPGTRQPVHVAGSVVGAPSSVVHDGGRGPVLGRGASGRRRDPAEDLAQGQRARGGAHRNLGGRRDLTSRESARRRSGLPAECRCERHAPDGKRAPRNSSTPAERDSLERSHLASRRFPATSYARPDKFAEKVGGWWGRPSVGALPKFSVQHRHALEKCATSPAQPNSTATRSRRTAPQHLCTGAA